MQRSISDELVIKTVKLIIEDVPPCECNLEIRKFNQSGEKNWEIDNAHIL